jgi:hypothetical protein
VVGCANGNRKSTEDLDLSENISYLQFPKDETYLRAVCINNFSLKD